MTEPRRWTIRGHRQSDEMPGGAGRIGPGVLVSGHDFRTYGEGVRVREDVVADTDVEAVRAWLLVRRLAPLDDDQIRGLLGMVLGEPS